MARHTEGGITKYVGKNGKVYRSLRFTVQGQNHRVPLGVVSEAEAERRLSHVMADVERGTWQPEEKTPAAPVAVRTPTFKAFAQEWWTLNKNRVTSGTRKDYRRRLEGHLLPFFEDYRLDEIKPDTVERYIAKKMGEDDPNSPRYINMTLIMLAAVMESAVERELIPRNPAKGKTRRVRESKHTRSHIDNAGQVLALLDAAGELDREAPEERRHVARRAMIAVLLFAGLRIGELCALRWQDVDLANGWLRVSEAKTDAGRRKVKIRGALRDELLTLRGLRQDAPQNAYVFATLRGGKMSANNFRNRVLGRAEVEQGRPAAGAIKRANERLEADGLPPLPPKITPHSLRRTFCSLLYALGEDPGVVMDEMGHANPALALAVYRQAMRRGDGEKAQLRALVEGETIEADGGADAGADPIQANKSQRAQIEPAHAMSMAGEGR